MLGFSFWICVTSGATCPKSELNKGCYYWFNILIDFLNPLNGELKYKSPELEK